MHTLLRFVKGKLGGTEATRNIFLELASKQLYNKLF